MGNMARARVRWSQAVPPVHVRQGTPACRLHLLRNLYFLRMDFSGK